MKLLPTLAALTFIAGTAAAHQPYRFKLNGDGVTFHESIEAELRVNKVDVFECFGDARGHLNPDHTIGIDAFDCPKSYTSDVSGWVYKAVYYTGNRSGGGQAKGVVFGKPGLYCIPAVKLKVLILHPHVFDTYGQGTTNTGQPCTIDIDGSTRPAVEVEAR